MEVQEEATEVQEEAVQPLSYLTQPLSGCILFNFINDLFLKFNHNPLLM